MQRQGLSRKVTSNTQVRCSSGASKPTYSCRSSGGSGGVGIVATLAHGWHAVRPTGEGAVAGEFDDIRKRLESISEELADLAIERLRESIDAGGTELPVDERRLTRARRSVEKAIVLLREPDDAL